MGFNEELDELPICINCGGSIKDTQQRVWQETSTGRNVAYHMYWSACVQDLHKRVEVLEGNSNTLKNFE